MKRALAVFVLVAWIAPAVFAAPGRADTYTSQPEDVFGLDTYLSSATPTTNYETNASLFVGEMNTATDVRRAILQFDLSSIPANSVISSATLSLWTINDFSSNPSTFTAHRIKQVWHEGAATWQNRTAVNVWVVGGCWHATEETSCEAADIGSRFFSSSEANGEKQFALDAAAIQEMVSGAFTNNGFLIKGGDEENQAFR